jgi:hypothetical protein
MSQDRAGNPGPVHRRRTAKPAIGRAVSAIALTGIIATGLTGVMPWTAVAGERTGSKVEELWRAYPLEQTTTTGAPTQGRSSDPGQAAGGRASAAGDRPAAASTGVPTAAIIGGAGALLLIGILLLGVATAARRRRREDDHWRAITPMASRTPVRGGPDGTGRAQAARSGTEAAVPPETAAGANGRPDAGALPSEPRVTPVPPPSAEGNGAADAPPSRSGPDAAGVEGARKGSAPNRRGPVCQIRWSRWRRRSCFEAFVVDEDGVEHMVARSPRIERPGSSPPEQTPEAKAAVRQLAKELRDDGWKPLRAKGKDFGAQQWYTRRFRRPVELDDDQADQPGPTEAPSEGKRNLRSG